MIGVGSPPYNVAIIYLSWTDDEQHGWRWRRRPTRSRWGRWCKCFAVNVCRAGWGRCMLTATCWGWSCIPHFSAVNSTDCQTLDKWRSLAKSPWVAGSRLAVSWAARRHAFLQRLLVITSLFFYWKSLTKACPVAPWNTLTDSLLATPSFESASELSRLQLTLFFLSRTHQTVMMKVSWRSCFSAPVQQSGGWELRELCRASRCAVLSVLLNPGCQLMPVPCSSSMRRYNLVKALALRHEILVWPSQAAAVLVRCWL